MGVPRKSHAPKMSRTPMKGKLSAPLPREVLITATIHRNRDCEDSRGTRGERHTSSG